MKSSWLCAALVGGVALLSLSACSDSSDVGLGVGPDSLRGGQPVTLNVEPEIDTARTSPITGDNRRETPVRDPWRFLVGEVDDPIPGTGEVVAEGYVDFAGRSTLPSEILSAENADSLSAELRLTTNYLHGDSSETLAVEVYDLMQDEPMDSLRASASLDADETQLVSADVTQISPTDSLVTIELRQSWIEDNLSILQDTSDSGTAFEEDFPGFKIVAPNSKAVVGFSSSNAALRLTYASESDTATADYTGLKSFTHIDQRNATGSPPSTLRLLQDGVGTELTMAWDFSENPLDSLENAPLNRAEIFVPIDTSAMNNYIENSGRPNFVQPLPKGYRMIATRTSDAPPCAAVQLPVFSDANNACVLPSVSSAAPGAALVSDNVAFSIFEESFRRVRNGQSPIFTEFRVHIADRESTTGNAQSSIQPGLPSTLPVLVPVVNGEDPGSPRATLTITPL